MTSTPQGSALPAGTRTLTIERVFDAPRALVWEAFTDPKHTVAWMGPPSHPSILMEGDLRPGGKWRGVLRSTSDGREMRQGGEYREIRAPERLAFTFYWDRDDGTRSPETLVEIDFAERGRQTLMTFRQGPFESVESRDGHRRGWNGSFDRLADYLASKSANR